MEIIIHKKVPFDKNVAEVCDNPFALWKQKKLLNLSPYAKLFM